MQRRLPGALWWLRPNTFQAADGIGAVFVGHDHVRYFEGDRSVLLDQELQADPRLVGIYRSSIVAWEAPYEAESLSDADRARIVENLRLAFQTRNYRLTELPE